MTADRLCRDLIYKELRESQRLIENAYVYLKYYDDSDNPECVDIARKYAGRMYMDVRRAMFYLSRAGVNFKELKSHKITFCIDGKSYKIDPEKDLTEDLPEGLGCYMEEVE